MVLETAWALTVGVVDSVFLLFFDFLFLGRLHHYFPFEFCFLLLEAQSLARFGVAVLVVLGAFQLLHWLIVLVSSLAIVSVLKFY